MGVRESERIESNNLYCSGKDVEIMTQNQEKPKTEQQQKEQDYREHVDQVTPKYNLLLQMVKAFVTGGSSV